MKATISSGRPVLRALWASLLFAGAARAAWAVAENPSNGHIAYEHKEGTGTRDIWYMKADGSGKKKLATDGTWPTWRPDGTKIAFNRNDETYVMDPDGSGQTRISGRRLVQWWGTGEFICRNATGDVYKVAYPGGGETVLVRKSEFTKLGSADYSPGGLTSDGRWLVAWSNRYDGGYTGDNGYFTCMNSAVMFDLQNRGRIYFIGPGCEATAPPSGNYVYHIRSHQNPATGEWNWYTRGPGAWRMNKGDTSRNSYVEEIAYEDADWGHEYFPRVSTDNQWLTYGATTGCHDHNTCAYQLFIHRLGAGRDNRKRITNDSHNNRWPHCFVGTLPATNPVSIDSFTASPSTITQGQSSTLSWATTNATSVTLDGASVNVDDSTTVSPANTTTYTLVAQGTGGPVTRTAEVTVTAAAQVSIDSFTASPSTITQGNSSTLSWATTNATSVTLDGATVNADGSTTVSPATTTTYTLVAQGTGGPVTGTAEVTVTSVQPVSVPFKMNCGKNSYTPSGWAEDDAYVTGGTDFDNWSGAISTAGVPNAAPAQVYETVRRMSPHTYTIPIANGSYVVRMHFCEGYTATSTRDVKYVIEGVIVEDHMDYATEAGAHFKAVAKDYDVTVTDGDIVIECTDYSSTDVFEAGIEILAGGGTTEPTITLVQPNGGEVWYVGTTPRIEWSAVRVGDVAISYYNASWEQIADTVKLSDAGWGSYPWLIPDDPGTDCRVSISDYLMVAAAAQSAASFEIRSVTDSDSDGMDDGWEMDNFGDLTHDGTVDTDGDGLSDYQEFDRATDPQDPNDPSDAPGPSDGGSAGFGCASVSSASRRAAPSGLFLVSLILLPATLARKRT